MVQITTESGTVPLLSIVAHTKYSPSTLCQSGKEVIWWVYDGVDLCWCFVFMFTVIILRHRRPADVGRATRHYWIWFFVAKQGNQTALSRFCHQKINLMKNDSSSEKTSTSYIPRIYQTPSCGTPNPQSAQSEAMSRHYWMLTLSQAYVGTIAVFFSENKWFTLSDGSP